MKKCLKFFVSVLNDGRFQAELEQNNFATVVATDSSWRPHFINCVLQFCDFIFRKCPDLLSSHTTETNIFSWIQFSRISFNFWSWKILCSCLFACKFFFHLYFSLRSGLEICTCSFNIKWYGFWSLSYNWRFCRLGRRERSCRI